MPGSGQDLRLLGISRFARVTERKYAVQQLQQAICQHTLARLHPSRVQLLSIGLRETEATTVHSGRRPSISA